MKRKFSDDIKTIKTYNIPAGGNDKIICPEKNEELLNWEGQEKYRSEVGIFLWLMKHSKPDIDMQCADYQGVQEALSTNHAKLSALEVM